MDEVLYVPAALALRQRPGVPGIRSTFGTGTELLNRLRLMYSRLASHRCPNGHYVPSTLAVAAEQPSFCSVCDAKVHAPSAEELAFNSQGACPTCGGTRLSRAARTPRLRGISLDEACKMSLSELVEWVAGVPTSLPSEMRPMAESICQSFQTVAKRLMDLGLGYLALDRAASALSTGERQRMQLAWAVRDRTTGVLYVLDEPSIGLHPSNIVGLTGVMHDLVADGNSVILVDHDTQILSEADWLIEMGPEVGTNGGRVVAQGTIPDVAQNKNSQIGSFLAGTADVHVRNRAKPGELFDLGGHPPVHGDHPHGETPGSGHSQGAADSGHRSIRLRQDHPDFGEPSPRSNGGSERTKAPKSRPGDGGSGHPAGGAGIDTTPIGINVRSTVATYTNVHDELRKLYAKTPDAKRLGFKAGDFSYNTGKLHCLVCDGTGVIDLDVQFLPDVTIPCPECHGSRYGKDAGQVRHGEYSLPDLMAMDVNTALEVCKDMKLVHQRLQVLQDLGLNYLTLGEETPSLSGGEAQRLKLASEMGRAQSDSVFVFDEPTIGLHPLDVCTLLGVFQTLINHGATVVVIEHDLDVIRNADYLIDMGPGGGDAVWWRRGRRRRLRKTKIVLRGNI